MKFTDIRPFIPVALFLAVLFFILPAGEAEAGKLKFYFFSSETNINNFKSLKMEFDGYLSKFGSYEFQAFNDKEMFEKEVRGKKECLLLLSSWHYSNISKDLSLISFLVGMRNGKHSQKRILVATSDAGELKGPVATAGNESNTKNTLEKMFPGKGVAESIRILTVPKDIDALMSVGFQMSKSALITEKTLDDLKTFDPMLHKRLKIIAEGKETLLPILAGPESFAENAKAAIDIIQKMPADPDGKNIIKMLDLDGWKPIDLH